VERSNGVHGLNFFALIIYNMNTSGEPSMMGPAQPAVSPARAACLPSTITSLLPEVTVPAGQGLALSSALAKRSEGERPYGKCQDPKEVTHRRTRSRALSRGTGLDASASPAALASTSFTMPTMMSLSWKSFGV
jgi:hypothetical protein